MTGVQTCALPILIKYNDPSESDQYEWLSEVLKKDRHSDVTLIFGHHPFFLADINEEDGYFQLQNAKRGRYFTLFKEITDQISNLTDAVNNNTRVLAKMVDCEVMKDD